MRVQIVSFRCTLKNTLGEFISSSTNQDVVTTPELQDSAAALPGFTMALKDLKLGDKKKIFVPAEQAYGFYNPELCIEVSRSELARGQKLKVNDEVKGRLTEDQQFRSFRVTQANPLNVTLDANHPLAGQDLEFDVEITDFHEEPKTDDVQFRPGRGVVQ